MDLSWVAFEFVVKGVALKLIALISFVLGLNPIISEAKTHQQAFTEKLSSEKFEVLPVNSDSIARPKSGLVDRLFDVLSQKPDFTPRIYSQTCRLEALEKQLMRNKSAALQSEAIESYLSRCRDEVERGAKNRVENTIQILRLRFDDLSHPFMRRVNLHLPGGVKMHAILATKGDVQKRPFVVVRLGVFGNIEEYFVESYVFRQLFEQGPFNVLVVENSTSKWYVKNNPGFSFGGAIEGLQNMQIAKLLRDPAQPISQIVDSIHFVGMSLGGHGILHAAALDAQQQGLPFINSFLGLCPVVRLKETVDNSIRSGLEGTIVDAWISHRTPSLRERADELRHAGWGTWWRLKPFYWRGAVDYTVRTYPAAPGLSEGLEYPMKNLSFWDASEPWAWFHKLKGSVLLMATYWDDVVPAKLNSQALIKELYQKKTPEDISVVMFQKGYHCTLPVAYDWNFVSAVLNSSLIASTSKSFQVSSRELDVTQLVKKTEFSKVKLSHKVEWSEGKRNPEIKIWINPASGLETTVPMEIPKEEMDFIFRNPDRSEAERQMGEAWLSRNIKLELEAQEEKTILKISWKKWSAGKNPISL